MDVRRGMLCQAHSQGHAVKGPIDATYNDICEEGDMLVRQLLQDVDLGFEVIEQFGCQD